MPANSTHPDGFLAAASSRVLSAARETFLPPELPRRPRRASPFTDLGAQAFALSSRSFGSSQSLHVVMSGSLFLLASGRVLPRRRVGNLELFIYAFIRFFALCNSTLDGPRPSRSGAREASRLNRMRCSNSSKARR